MDAHNERSPLLESLPLPSQRQEWAHFERYVCNNDEEAYPGSNASEDDSESDEASLNEVMAEYGTSVRSLGLDGGVQGFPLGLRRGSIASNFGPPHSSRRDSRASRRKTRLNRPELSERNAQSSRPGGFSASSKPSVVTIENVAESTSESNRCKGDEFLGNVSRGRFWAVFSSILLVYFVSRPFKVGLPSLI